MKTYTDRIADTNSSLDSMQGQGTPPDSGRRSARLWSFHRRSYNNASAFAGRGSMGLYKPVSEGGSKDAVSTKKKGNQASHAVFNCSSFLQELFLTFTNLKFIIPFALNQSGSMVYYYLLGTADISLASPICNSLTFTFTAITSWLIGEKIDSPFFTIIGIFFVLIGVTLCTLSRV